MARRSLGIGISLLSMLAVYAGSAFGQARFDDTAIGIPEPGTLTLLGSGLAALAGIAWFGRRK